MSFTGKKWIAGALNPMSLTGCWRSWKRSENWMLSLHRISMGCTSWLDQNVSMRSMGRPTKIIVHPAERESARIIFLRRPGIPRCPKCGGMIRPQVTLYEEGLPEDAVRGAVDVIRKADTLIVAGTSLNVYPAASYVYEFRGDHLIVLNKEPLHVQLNQEKDLFIEAAMGQVFVALEDALF